MRHTSRLKNFIWYSLATLLVTAAVLVTIVRMSIGSVSEYRQHLEDMAGRYLGKPVAIAEMDARLVGIKPTVVLDDISLLDEQSREPLAHFSSIRIALNPTSSLRQLQPVVDLTIFGAHIVAGLRKDGTLQVQGVTLSSEGTGNSSGALGKWLLGQSRLALRESTIVWRNWDTGDETTFAGVELELQNQQSRHRLSGEVQLPEELGKELRMALDIHGDLLTQKDWLGELYVKAEQVRPASWMQTLDYKGLQLKRGSVDLEMWSRWQGGLLEGLEGNFNLDKLKFTGETEPLQLKRIAGEVRYESGDEGLLLQLQKLHLEHEDLPVEQLALRLETNSDKTILQATSLPLTLLQRYAPYLPTFHEMQQELIAQTAPSGKLGNVHIELGGEGQVRATADVEALQFSAWKRYPGISGLNGHFAMDGDVAELKIDTPDFVFSWPHIFRQPLNVQSASGSLLLSRTGKQWRITSNDLTIANQDILATVSLDSWITPGESPLISLQAQVEKGRAAAVPAYLPVHIMPSASVQWLDKAFIEGHVPSGRVLLHGRLDKFPFRQPQGNFEVGLEAEDVTLHYQDGWPNLKQVEGEVRINGSAISITTRQARIYSARLHNAHATIDLRQPMLQIEGEADASLPETLRFLQESPLAKHAGDSLGQMRSEGRTKIDLALAIPLSAAMAKHSPLTVIGRAGFEDGKLQVRDGVALSDLTGNLTFTEKSFEANSIQGQLYDAPLKLQVFTEQLGERRQVVVAAQGRATAEALKREWGIALLDRLKGETDWQSRLTIPYGEGGEGKLDLHSTLQGMAIDLPQPADKSGESIRPLSVTWHLGDETAQANRLVYGDLVSVIWQQQSDPFRLRGATVGFGGTEPDLLKPGVILVNGTLENVQLREWLKLQEQIPDSGSTGTPLPLEVAMQRLHLVATDAEEGSAEAESGGNLHVNELPPVRFIVENFAHGDIKLGRIEVILQPADGKLLIETVAIKAPSFKANASGQWVEGGNTQIELKLSSGDFGRMMRELGFASVIAGGKTSAKGQLFWPGSPASFNLAQLNGEMHVNIENGRMVEVEAGAGKLLGLLSLQALPRRLFLDFSDLSGEGLQFTTLKGDIRFSEGNAYTQNLQLESLPADILITGRTGLVAQDFDQLIAVVPNVSDTVSVAGGLYWGPQAAALLIVLQKLFQNDIDAAAMTRYHLSGSWAEPKLSKINGDDTISVDQDF